MRKDDDIRLRHMLDAARKAVAFARGRTRADLDKDRQLVLALVKDVEIVSDAATQVTEPTRQRLAQVPWERIVGMHNRLVHAYFDINLDIVWKTVRGDSPELISLLEPAIPPERGSTPGGRVVARVTIERLIVDSPYEEPARQWRYDRTMRLFDLADGRRDMCSLLRTQGHSTIPACS